MTAIANMYGMYSIKNGGVVVPTMAVNTNTNIQETIQAASGQVDSTFAATISANPTIEISTMDIRNALTALGGVSGLAISGGTAALVAAYQLLDEGGTRDVGATAYTVTVTAGLIVPTAITASQGGIATIGYMAYANSTDGVTAPWTTAASATLADTSSVTELYTLGPIKMAAAFIDGIQDCTFDFGLDVQARTSDGMPYPSWHWINSRQPSVVATGFDVGQLDETALGIPGASVATSSIVYFRQIQEGSIPYADNQSKHIKITLTQSRASVVSVPSSQGSEATVGLRITPTYDGSNAVAIIATNQTIA